MTSIGCIAAVWENQQTSIQLFDHMLMNAASQWMRKEMLFLRNDVRAHKQTLTLLKLNIMLMMRDVLSRTILSKIVLFARLMNPKQYIVCYI